MRRLAPLLVAAACHHASPAPAPAAAHAAVPAAASAPVQPAGLDACADPEADLIMPDGEIAVIDPNGVMRALDRHRGEMRRCFERNLKRDLRAGSVVATFVVAGDGTVAHVQVHGFAAALDRCLCGIVARVQFPPPHSPAIVSYPMHFAGEM
jgi:hypothetical protein